MISYVPYSRQWATALREFNTRIAASGFEFPEEVDGEATIAIENERHIRGAYILRTQAFSLNGESATVAHYRLPLSEAIVNRAYATMGIQLLRHALQRQPMLYALGMGGMENPLPKMLKAAGWLLHPVPFHFKVVRPGAFLRQIRPLRKVAGRRIAMDLAAWTGAGWLAFRFLQPPISRAASHKAILRFETSADKMWERCRAEYPVTAWRDSAVLNGLYAESRFHKIGVEDGWAVALDTKMQDDPHFGNMRVATIVDGLAPLGQVNNLLRATTRFLEQRGVDLIISNQAHRQWNEGLAAAGFRTGPTNFVFAASKKLAERISDPHLLHINRGDGDGPIHL